MSAEGRPDFSKYADINASEARRKHEEEVAASRREHQRDVDATKRQARKSRGKTVAGGLAAAAVVAGGGELVDRQIEYDEQRGERHAPLADSIAQQAEGHELRQEARKRLKKEGKIDAEALRSQSGTDTSTETGLTGRDDTVDVDGVTGSVELDQGADYEATSGIIPEGSPESGGVRYPAPEDHMGETGGAAAG